MNPRLEAGQGIVAAHRGASRLAPENTVAAFERALAAGAAALELDVHLTRDGRVAVVHDDTLDRTTDRHGPVSDQTAEELRHADAGAWFGPEFVGERLPLLEDVLDLTAGRARLHIELKGRPSRRLAEAVVDLVHRHRAADRVIVMSFDLQAVLAARQADAEMATMAIVSAPLPDQLGFVLATGLTGLNQAPRLWDAETAARFHDRGLIVHGSLINDPAELDRFFALGGDMADSDEPACYGQPPK